MDSLTVLSEMPEVFSTASNGAVMGWFWLIGALVAGIVRVAKPHPRVRSYFFGACAIAMVNTLAASSLVLIEGLTHGALATSSAEQLKALSITGKFAFVPLYGVAFAAGALCSVRPGWSFRDTQWRLTLCFFLRPASQQSLSPTTS